VVNDAPATAAPVETPHTFRASQLGQFVAITLAICVTPLAISAWWLLELYLIPIAVAYLVRHVGTTVDGDGLSTRGVFRSRRVTWEHVTALRLRTRSRVSAVLDDGSELPLPAVHLRDLPALAAVSGGRIPDPTTAHEVGPAPTGPTAGAAEPASTEPASPEE
jgi:hypothetical protein